MFDIGGGEIIFIIFAILLLFGPKKIPEFAKMVKKGMSEVKKAQSAFQEHITDIKDEINKPIVEIIEKANVVEPDEKNKKIKPTADYLEYEAKKNSKKVADFENTNIPNPENNNNGE